MRIRLMALTVMALAIAAPAGAQTPAEPMPPPAPMGPTVPTPLKPGDAFGEEIVLPGGTLVGISGRATWDVAFEKLTGSFKALQTYMSKQGLKATGPALTIYTETDDKGFSYRAGYQIAETPKEAPTGEITVGPAPSGKALKFVHRGSYDAMDSTYEAITNFLDDKRLEAKDLFIEEYATDPATANPDSLVVNVFVPIK